MDLVSLPALAALSGSAIGSFTTFFATWRGVRAQFSAQLLLQSRNRREELYREFVEEASALYIDALTRDEPEPGRLVRLYALISRMRILSTPPVVAEADRIARLVIDAYTEPNKSLGELRAMLNRNSLDPLSGFAQVCRHELECQSTIRSGHDAVRRPTKSATVQNAIVGKATRGSSGRVNTALS